MPYYVIAPTTTADDLRAAIDDDTAIPLTKPEAIDQRACLDGGRIVYLPNYDELSAWIRREQRRDATPAPEPNMFGIQHRRVDSAANEFSEPCHPSRLFPYLSTEHPGKIAYTPTHQHGHEDRQLVTTPARYADRYFDPETEPARRDAWLAEVRRLAHGETVPLQIETDPDRIARIYAANAHGGIVSFSSCMDGRDFPDPATSPMRAYGAPGDLALAWIGDWPDDRPFPSLVRARAIVWPAKRQYGRRYGDDGLLSAMLKADGWSHACTMIDARLNVVTDGRGRILAPYVDVAETADLCTRNGGRWLVLASCGEWSVRNTNGIATEIENNDDDVPTCENCGDDCADDEMLCDTCLDNRRICNSCGAVTFDEDAFIYRGGRDVYVCESCDAEHDHECAACGLSFNDRDFTLTEWRNRDQNLCSDCEDKRQCERCDDYTEDGRDYHGDWTCQYCVTILNSPRQRSRGTILRRWRAGEVEITTVAALGIDHAVA